MWRWACGGAVTAAAVGFVAAGGHRGPCPGQTDDRIVTPPPAPPKVVVRYDEPPLARRPAGRYSSPGDPF